MISQKHISLQQVLADTHSLQHRLVGYTVRPGMMLVEHIAPASGWKRALRNLMCVKYNMDGHFFGKGKWHIVAANAELKYIWLFAVVQAQAEVSQFAQAESIEPSMSRDLRDRVNRGRQML